MPNGPLEAVFTTVLWDSQMNIADFGRHIARLNDHASRLRINLPSDIKQRIATQIVEKPFYQTPMFVGHSWEGKS